MRHILLLNDDYPPHGRSSVSTVTAALRTAYESAGHRVSVLTTHRPETGREVLRENGVTSLPVEYRKSLRQYLSLWNPAISAMLREEFAHLRPDAVHAHNIHRYLSYAALPLSRRHARRVVLTLHDAMSFSSGRLHTDRYLRSGGADARVTAADHRRMVGLEWNPWRDALILRCLRRGTDAIVTPSDALRRAALQNDVPVTQVIPNAIDAAAWTVPREAIEAFRARHGLRRRPVILFGGRIGVDKGMFALLSALRKVRAAVPNAVLLVVGDAARWEALAEAGGFGDLRGHWICAGWLDREEMRAAFSAADVVTTPSLCLDVFPTMNLEAMAARKPVVGTTFGGTPEMVEDGETGHLVDPRDSSAFAAALVSLLRDSNAAKRMGEAGYRKVTADFTPARQTDAYLHLLVP